MGVLVCLGGYAKEPFTVDSLGAEVSCIEELGYLLKENAYLLDRGIMTDRIAEFVEVDLGLTDLGRELSDMIHRKGSLSTFVTAILRYTCLFDEGDIDAIAAVLRQGGKMNGLEKQKMRADRLVEKRRYDAALSEYEALITEVVENMEIDDWSMRTLLGKLWYNKGVTYTRLMVYSQAAECFLKADEVDPRSGYQRDFLAAKRLELSDKDYISFVAENVQYYEASLQLEKETAKLFEEYTESFEERKLEKIRNLELEGQKLQYYEEVEKYIDKMVENYRTGGIG